MYCLFLFQGYAKHRKPDVDWSSVVPNYADYKAKFRAAISHSAEFEYVADRSQTHLQYGNFKVWKLLSAAESAGKL